MIPQSGRAKKLLLIPIAILGLILFSASNGDSPIKSFHDFVQRIEETPGLARRIGLHKLAGLEKAALNEYCNDIYNDGLHMGRMSQNEYTVWNPHGNFTHPSGMGRAFKTYIRKIEAERFTLHNDAVIRVGGILPDFTPHLQNVVLFSIGDRWNLWIEDVGTLPCRLIQLPRFDDGDPAWPSVIDVVAGRGAAILCRDGSVYNLSSFDISDVRDWHAHSRILQFGEDEMINLDFCNDIVEVTRLR